MTDPLLTEPPSHFKGKEAFEHVVEAKAKGLLSSAEIHGTEIPGHLSSAADSARETAVFLFILWLVLFKAGLAFPQILQTLGIASLGWVVWKSGRSAWLAWYRLERMHRIVEQERWEIQHHRCQEKDELKELYRAKGFEGKLLDDVIDTLMADDDRLLKEMVEEELCLSLGTQEHPLKQAFGAAVGTTFAFALCILFFLLFPQFGMWPGTFLTLAAAAAVSAYYEGNKAIPAIVWNLGLGALSLGCIYFLLAYVKG